MGANIDQFNIITGLMLAELYESFPSPKTIHSGAFASRVEGCPLPEDRSGTDPASASIRWLVEEGYIRCRSLSEIPLFSQAVLSSKGLQLLSMPDSLNAQESIGAKMMEASKSGALEGLKSLAKLAVCEGGRFLFRAGAEALMSFGPPFGPSR